MTEKHLTYDGERVVQKGEGYANLIDENSFGGRIEVTPNWVIVDHSNGRYTIPRRRIDFINWKEVN